MGAERVFDGELVQAELGAEIVQLGFRWPAQVDPHHGVRSF